jgi:putative hydrolase of the HAD superfamily
MVMNDSSSLSGWVVVFDLDDTLYKENEYNHSGVITVAEVIEQLYGKNITEQLLEVRNRKGDIWECACELLNLPHSVKESFLWMYRLHTPKIELNKKTVTFMKEVANYSNQVVILTDGRSVTQRIKLNALSLLEYPLYISEEYASNKPEEKRFKQIMKDFVAYNYVYIADNPVKDFVAPNKLGWRTVGVLNTGNNIHYQQSNLDKQYDPTIWVNNIEDIVSMENQ